MSLRRSVLCAIALLLSAPAHAHTALAASTPKSGSILPASPAEVSLTFKETTRLTSAEVVVAGAPGRRLRFAPTGAATTFVLDTPLLADGRNEIKWKALSKDGHVVSGSVILVIKPGATASAPADQTGHSEHKP